MAVAPGRGDGDAAGRGGEGEGREGLRRSARLQAIFFAGHMIHDLTKSRGCMHAHTRGWGSAGEEGWAGRAFLRHANYNNSGVQPRLLFLALGSYQSRKKNTLPTAVQRTTAVPSPGSQPQEAQARKTKKTPQACQVHAKHKGGTRKTLGASAGTSYRPVSHVC